MSSELRTGDLVLGQSCPRCRRQSVVYNGNYFCTECSWAMGENNRPERIIKAYLTQRYVYASQQNDQDEIDRLGSYLAKYADNNGE